MPFFIGYRNQLGICLAVTVVGTPEKNLSADHPHQRPITKYILRILAVYRRKSQQSRRP